MKKMSARAWVALITVIMSASPSFADNRFRLHIPLTNASLVFGSAPLGIASPSSLSMASLSAMGAVRPGAGRAAAAPAPSLPDVAVALQSAIVAHSPEAGATISASHNDDAPVGGSRFEGGASETQQALAQLTALKSPDSAVDAFDHSTPKAGDVVVLKDDHNDLPAETIAFFQEGGIQLGAITTHSDYSVAEVKNKQGQSRRIGMGWLWKAR